MQITAAADTNNCQTDLSCLFLQIFNLIDNYCQLVTDICTCKFVSLSHNTTTASVHIRYIYIRFWTPALLGQ